MTQIINGKNLAAEHEKRLKNEIAALQIKPKVVSILIGDDPPSILYTNMKQKKALDVGIDFVKLHLPSTTPFEHVEQKIVSLNRDREVDGIMIQLPLPEEFLTTHSEEELIRNISPEKDFDGLTGRGTFLPAVVRAVFSILEDEKVALKGKKVVVMGRSRLIGKPVAEKMRLLGADVEVVHSQTGNPMELTKKADVIVAATGKPKILKGEMVKEGVVVIDVGTQKINGKLVGDVEFQTVFPKAAKITPVPGGVGPMTVISLMENVVDKFKK